MTDVYEKWAKLAGDPEAKWREAADLLSGVLYELNIAAGDDGPHELATSREGTAYWFVERALMAALLGVTGGNEADAWRLRELWADNQEDTAYNLGVLAAEKRAASVIVTMAADHKSATVMLPGGIDCTAGQLEGGELVWVADEVGSEIGTGLDYEQVARLLADHYGYPPETAVVVEYLPSLAHDGSQAG